MEEGKVIFGVGLDTKSFEMQIKKTEDDLERLEEEYSLLEKGPDFAEKEETLKKLGAEIETAKNKLISLKKEQAKIDNGIFDRMNNGLSKCVKTISHWALALVGIRSMYNAIRNATSTLSEYNDDLKNKLEGMKLVMATSLEPLVTRIVDLAYKLMTYVNYIAKAWFNVDLFAKAGEKSMKKASKTMKDMSKTKASFDVFNTLGSKNSSKSSGEDVITFPKMEDVEVPSWVQWIADNKDKVLNFLKAVGILIATMGIGKLVGDLGLLGNALSGVWGLLAPLVTFIAKNAAVIAGIALIVGGLALVIDGIIKYLNDPSWENFQQILLGIAVIGAGVLLLFGGIPALITTIVLLIGSIALAIHKNWNTIKSTLGGVAQWFYNVIIHPVIQFFSGLWNAIVKGAVSSWEGVKGAFKNVVQFFNHMINTISGALRSVGIKAGEIVGNAFKSVINGVLWTVEKIINTPIKAINGLIGVINKVPGINLGTLNEVKLPRLRVGGIINKPGKGVPVGGGKAVGGESGPEGVLPLTNNQQMEYLGQAIGKYVRIDNYIENNMDSKRINRVTKTSSSRRDFALNRG